MLTDLASALSAAGECHPAELFQCSLISLDPLQLYHWGQEVCLIVVVAQS